MAATETDRALVGRVAKGDRAAVRLLFMRHHARVFRFVVRQTGSEMMADELPTRCSSNARGATISTPGAERKT
nr:hypothetical protein [Mesorhizobium sp.]